MRFSLTLFVLLLSYLSSVTPCTTDSDCNLNGICTSGVCHCDPGWSEADCGKLDLLPATKGSGYNLTGNGTSSWGSKIVRDPKDSNLYHLFAAEFQVKCGLDYWAPFSRVIRAESRTGPAGPYKFAAEVAGSFAHNPTVVYSPADRLYLLYAIGCPVKIPTSCQSIQFTCGDGNNVNGESGVSVWVSPDLRSWTFFGQVFKGSNDQSLWDADSTNPTPLPLYSSSNNTAAVLLVYRGCPYNCAGNELINVATAPTFKGPYTRLHKQPIFGDSNEDPFVWRDKRGNYHMLTHSLEPNGGFGWGPNVGRHAYATEYDGAWTFNNNTLSFSTHVQFTDGSTIEYFRRERPQLFFSDDGEMRPLYLTTGVQEQNSPMTYSVIQPVASK